MNNTKYWNIYAAKIMKGDSASAYVHIMDDIPSPYTQLYTFSMTLLPPHLRTYQMDAPFIEISNLETTENWLLSASLNKIETKTI